MPAPARKRGPKPNPERGTPSGFRINARTRFELEMASLFVGTRSLQETIDLAVGEWLQELRKVPGFEEALAAAESHQRTRGKVSVVPPEPG